LKYRHRGFAACTSARAAALARRTVAVADADAGAGAGPVGPPTVPTLTIDYTFNLEVYQYDEEASGMTPANYHQSLFNDTTSQLATATLDGTLVSRLVSRYSKATGSTVLLDATTDIAAYTPPSSFIFTVPTSPSTLAPSLTPTTPADPRACLASCKQAARNVLRRATHSNCRKDTSSRRLCYWHLLADYHKSVATCLDSTCYF